MSYYSRHVEFLSHEPSRREPWRGYADKDGPRRAIAYYERNGGTKNLRFFSPGRVGADGLVFYLEIPRSDWGATFAAD